MNPPDGPEMFLAAERAIADQQAKARQELAQTNALFAHAAGDFYLQLRNAGVPRKLRMAMVTNWHAAVMQAGLATMADEDG